MMLSAVRQQESTDIDKNLVIKSGIIGKNASSDNRQPPAIGLAHGAITDDWRI